MSKLNYPLYEKMGKFAKDIEEKGIVSRDEVLNFESAFGDAYPEELPSNKMFTTTPSSTGLTELVLGIECARKDFMEKLKSEDPIGIVQQVIERAEMLINMFGIPVNYEIIEYMMSTKSDDGVCIGDLNLGEFIFDSSFERLAERVSMNDVEVHCIREHIRGGLLPLIAAIKGGAFARKEYPSTYAYEATEITVSDVLRLFISDIIIDDMKTTIRHNKHLLVEAQSFKDHTGRNMDFWWEVDGQRTRLNLLQDETSLMYLRIIMTLIKE